jgi:integrase
MSIHWDKRNKRWRYEFDAYVQGRRHRATKLLPKGWSKAEADAFDRTEGARLYAVAAGVVEDDPLIETAVALYLNDKTHLKSYKATAEHLASIAWAYIGKRMSELPEVAKAVRETRAKAKGEGFIAPATIKQRLSWLKAACRWAWKAHKLTRHDPTTGMLMPAVNNERHVYRGRKEMLQACRSCTNWEAQIAIRVGFYTGMRLGEILRARPSDGMLVLTDTKNGDRRAVPVHHKIAHLVKFFPLSTPETFKTKRRTIQAAWDRAKRRVGLHDTTFHDLRHSAASEMVNGGVDLFTVGQVLGHRDSRSTKRYSHLTADKLAEAVSKIGKRAA